MLWSLIFDRIRQACCGIMGRCPRNVNDWLRALVLVTLYNFGQGHASSTGIHIFQYIDTLYQTIAYCTYRSVETVMLGIKIIAFQIIQSQLNRHYKKNFTFQNKQFFNHSDSSRLPLSPTAPSLFPVFRVKRECYHGNSQRNFRP